MSRYTGPVWKRSRRLSFSTLENGKELNRRNYAPGMHGQKRKKLTEYGIQQAEKQKVRYVYGMGEKQFLRTFHKAEKMAGKAGENFLFLLESRIDNLVYRAGFAATRAQARQLVNHGHFTLNGKKANIPSIQVMPGDVIAIKEKSKNLKVIKEALEATISRKDFIEFDENKLTATYTRLPERNEILPDIKENLIVEFYSR